MGKRGKKSTPIEDRIKKKIISSGECELWLGHMNGGTPSLCINKQKSLSIRKFIWLKAGNSLCKRLTNSCGNDRCVKLEHIIPRIQEGKHPLNKEDVIAIRSRWALHKKHTTSMRDLAREFNTTRQNIHQIIQGYTWKEELSEQPPENNI